MYDPNIMPRTMEEWEQLIAFYFKESQDKYNSDVAAAKAQAKAQYEEDLAANPELEQTLADYEANAVAMVEQPKTRAELEATYGCYKPGEDGAFPLAIEDMNLSRAVYSVAQGFYSVGAQDFVEGEQDFSCLIDLGDADNDTLRRTLEFYGLPVGACLLDLESLRARRLKELGAAFETACASATLMSSVGFEIDADETANRNVEGLIKRMENDGSQSVDFCAADNSVHPVSLADLKTMQLEIIAYGQELYARKWGLRSAIMAAATKEALAAIAIEL